MKTLVALALAAMATAACNSESPITPGAPASTCSYRVSPTGVRVPISGGTSSVSVVADVGSACQWTASTTDAWIRLGGTTTGQGAGVVTIAMDAPTTTFRRGTVTVAWIGGTTSINVDQGCPMVNTANLSPESQLYQIAIPSGCSFYSTPDPIVFDVPWISFVSTGGNGTLLLIRVAGNTGPERTGHVTTGLGQVTISQGAGNCVTAIAPTAQMFDETGGAGAITVTAASGACTWDAIAHDYIGSEVAPAIAHGTGNGILQFSVAPNTDPFRHSPFFTIGGALQFLITQSACPLTVSSLNVRVPAAGGEFSITVTVTGRVECHWTDYTYDSAFVIRPFEERVGTGAVQFTVPPNRTPGQERIGMMYVAGQNVQVTQSVPTP